MIYVKCKMVFTIFIEKDWVFLLNGERIVKPLGDFFLHDFIVLNFITFPSISVLYSLRMWEKLLV